jgi:hypothetical protein
MATLKDFTTEALRELCGFACLTACTLAINAASAATFKTTGTTTYTNDGKFKTKTALAAQAFTAGHAGLAIGQTGYYVVGLDGSGGVKTFEGIDRLPDVDSGYTAIGIIKVVAGSAAFVPGTTALDAAGLTVTYTDVMVLPSVAP